MLSRISLLLAAVVALAALAPVCTSLPASVSQEEAPTRIGAGTEPVDVEVGIYVNDILEVNGATQLLTVDFFLVERWRDPSLVGGEPRAVPITELWTPRVLVVNEGRLFSKLPSVARIDADGVLSTVQRYVGTLSNRMPLADFPFDSQTFGIDLTVGKAHGNVRLRGAEEFIGQRPDLTLTDWDVEPGRMVDKPYYFAPSGQDMEGLAYEMQATRRLSFYVWKGVVPLSLVVLMAFTVFWIDPTQLGSRISVSVTSMLTLIAYRFLLGSLLPRLAYLTRMDAYTLGCTGLVFLTLIGVVASGHFRRTGREAAADGLDRTGRILLPLGLVAIGVKSFYL